jgi:hypothetical protein
VSNDRLINEAEGIWKETGVAQFKVLSKHLREGTVEYNEKPQSGQLVSGKNLNRRPL